MKIHFLGTCAGTEPMPDRKHSSLAVEAGGRCYWFDAGEGCSRTAYLLGIDLLKVGKVIISHTHMDHIGGLGNLLWNIRKVSGMERRLPKQGAVDVYIPNMESWEGLMLLLRNTESNFRTEYPVNGIPVNPGLLFDDGTARITAYPNTHMSAWEKDRCLSFSYLMECEGKRIVYSGDVGKYQDLDEAIGDGCDGLIVETGHFGMDVVRDYTAGKKINRIFFTHNGREILSDPEAAKAKAEKYFGKKAVICQDGMSVLI